MDRTAATPVEDRSGPADDDGGRAKVLLVEDSPTQALRTQAVLMAGGLEVEVAGDGAAAIAAARSGRPDLILLDMNLPDQDGRSVARKLKQDPLAAGIPIIFLTGVFRDVQDLVDALEGGGDDYLVKPVEDGELLARVRASLRAKIVQRELGRLVRLLLSVNQVANAIAGVLDREGLAGTIVKSISEQFGYSYATMYLVEESMLLCEASSGGPCLAGARRDIAPTTIAGAAAASGSIQTGDPARFDAAEAGSVDAMAVPFKAGGRLIGVLEVGADPASPFSEHDDLAMGTLADLIGMAMQNASLFREMEELAMVDGLTGLSNRRSIMAQIESEFERARRYHRSLTLLSVDVDRFKHINDTYGHPSGDRALEAIADAIRAATRRVDLSGRLGGDEFLVVLPETDQENALIVAERLRESCARLVLKADDGTPFHLSISLGIASLPETNADFVAELLGAVDQALYRAKNSGRNRISV